nr:hypothetical protein [Tanacetum cinerariifolium]
MNDDDDDDDNDNDDDDDANNQDDGQKDDGLEYDGQDDESQDDDNEQTDSDNDGDDFVYPKFSTHDQDERQDEEDSFHLRVQTPSHVESTDDEDNAEEIQGVNVEGDERDEEDTNEEDEGDELYRDVNVNLEGRDIEMRDAQQIMFKLLNPDTDIDSIFNHNTDSTSLVVVSVNTITEPPLFSATTLLLPPTPLISHLQQRPSDRLRDEDQAENKDFINKLDDNMKKIFKDQVKEQVKAQGFCQKFEKTLNEQLEAEVLILSSNESNTSHDVAANLSKLELKKILIDKIESNKSIHISDE